MKFLVWILTIVFVVLGSIVLLTTVAKQKIFNAEKSKEIVAETDFFDQIKVILKRNTTANTTLPIAERAVLNDALDSAIDEYNYSSFFNPIIDDVYKKVGSADDNVTAQVDVIKLQTDLNQAISTKIGKNISTNSILIPSPWVINLQQNQIVNIVIWLLENYNYLVWSLIIVFILLMAFSIYLDQGYAKASYLGVLFVGLVSFSAAVLFNLTSLNLRMLTKFFFAKTTPGIYETFSLLFKKSVSILTPSIYLYSVVLVLIGVVGAMIVNKISNNKKELQ